ncbi:metallophosphoesterase [Alicyclobacillus tolerans]|uniref:metallophosphoesterase family protein n=1 Tax=Alicyclobacillus tolerans TaxID=90970 RepID=UPI001F477C77|nr:metallophosphoesterase family protein [Alicyclobacillus tolerans]MCF8568481.1 metallophosphoesterase [Alicyclobacillus tolerans]
MLANYNFVYMGDTWIAKSDNCDVINYTGEFVFNDALVQAKKYNPQFVLHGGDAAFAGNRPSLLRFKNEKVKKAFPSTRFYVSPGNHDALFTTANGKRRISFNNFKQIINPLNFVTWLFR